MRIAPIKINTIKPISFGIKINGKEGSFEDLYQLLDFDDEKQEEEIEKPEEPQKIEEKRPIKAEIEREYYFINWQNGKKIPVNDKISRRKTPKGSMLFVAKDGIESPYTGHESQTYKGQIIGDTLYKRGFPEIVTQYQGGVPIKDTKYNTKTHRIEWVSYCDGSFRLEKSVRINSTELNFRENKDNRRTFITILAPRNEACGFLDCYVYSKNNEGETEEFSKDIRWNFPGMSIKTSGDDDKKEIIKALKRLQEVIYSPEYHDNFGKTGYLNIQLRDVIKYLEENN